MSTIDSSANHIDDVTGNIVHKTFTGDIVPACFWPAVAEYHDVLEKASLIQLVNFKLSDEAIEKTIENVQSLAKSLNKKGTIDLDKLPLAVYDWVHGYELILLNEKETVAGTKAYEKYYNCFDVFREELTKKLAKSYSLPNVLIPTEDNWVMWNVLIGHNDPEQIKQINKKSKRKHRGGRAVSYGVQGAALPALATLVMELIGLSMPGPSLLELVDPLPFLVITSGVAASIGVGIGMFPQMKSEVTFVHEKNFMDKIWTNFSSYKIVSEEDVNLPEILALPLSSMRTLILQEKPI